MKKILLLLTAPFAFFFVLSAQIMQEKADSIVMERLNQETQPYNVYAKKGVQTNMIVTTSAGETLELDYACWVYYFEQDFACSFLIVNESNGSLVEVNPKGYATPCDLAEWRKLEKETYPIEISFEEYSPCTWIDINDGYDDNNKVIIINDEAELSYYIQNCPEIDFSKYTLLWTKISCTSPVIAVEKQFLQISDGEYLLHFDVATSAEATPDTVIVAIIVPKLPPAVAAIELKVTAKLYPIEIPIEEYSLAETSCQWTNLICDNTLIIINSNKELNQYVSCTEGSYPEIDFSKYTLLLTKISGTLPVIAVEKQFLQISNSKYRLCIDVATGMGDMLETVVVALKVPKLPKVTVELNVKSNILLEEYSLAGISCWWINLDSNNMLTIINSNEELENYITCTNGSYPEINFSEKTLLLASGYFTSQPAWIIDAALLEESANKYILKLTISPGAAASPSTWRFAFLTPKLTNEVTVTLDVQLYP